VTVAVYVVAAPTLTVLDASSVVEVESDPIVMVSLGLTEPARTESAAGENTAVRLAVDAGNEVEHATLALWPFGATAMFAHPCIGAPLSSKVTVPQDPELKLTIDVTVAITVTEVLVTAPRGDASRAVVVGKGPIGAAGPTVALLAGGTGSAEAAPAAIRHVMAMERTATPMSRQDPARRREQRSPLDSTRSHPPANPLSPLVGLAGHHGLWSSPVHPCGPGFLF